MENLILFLFYFYVFIVGACIGSFVNVIALRLPAGQSFVHGRSACPHCGADIRPLDLVPILGYIVVKGRCRSCRGKISVRYPLVEIASGAIFILCFWWWQGSFLMAVNSCLLAALLLLVFLIDLDTMTIPNAVVLCLLVPCAISLSITGFNGIWEQLLGIIVVSLPMLALTWILPGSFGGGDIKLMAVCGFYLGYQATLLAAFLAVIAAGLTAIVLLAAKKVNKGEHIAFGPYLTVGIFISALFYEPMMAFYLSLFGL